MWLLGKTLVTIAVIHSCVQAVDIRTFTRDWSLSNNSLKFKNSEDLSRADNRFVYSVCDGSKMPVQMECDVKIETLSESSTPEDMKVCHLKITAGEKRQLNGVIGEILTMSLLGKDKVLIMGVEDDKDNEEVGYLRLNLLDMNKCSDIQMIFPYDEDNDFSRTEVIPYDDTFDVITSGKEPCDGAETCRLTFDREGKRIAGPVSLPFNLTALEVLPVQKSSSAQGFYVLGYTQNPDKLIVTRLGVDGSKTRLMKVEKLHPFTTRTASSNNHDSYGVCWSYEFKDSEIRCVQFVARDGDARLNVTLPLEEHRRLKAVHNLPDGLLVLTMTKKKPKCNNFEVTKILADGPKGSIKVDGLDLQCGIGEISVTADVMDAGDEFCFNFVSNEVLTEDEKFVEMSMQYKRKCISKRDVDAL